MIYLNLYKTKGGLGSWKLWFNYIEKKKSKSNFWHLSIFFFYIIPHLFNLKPLKIFIYWFLSASGLVLFHEVETSAESNNKVYFEKFWKYNLILYYSPSFSSRNIRNQKNGTFSLINIKLKLTESWIYIARQLIYK